MKRLTAGIAVVAVACSLTGCTSLARQPELRNALVAPAELHPQESAIISAQVRDHYGIVKRVEAVVRESPQIHLKLHDDGKEGDAKAGDGIWTLQREVPFIAAPGEFTLDISAYNSKGDIIVVRTRQGDSAPLTASCTVVIRPTAP